VLSAFAFRGFGTNPQGGAKNCARTGEGVFEEMQHGVGPVECLYYKILQAPLICGLSKDKVFILCLFSLYFTVHIAAATVASLDFIVSLNFRHIVKHKTIIETEIINAREGFKRVFIHTPAEVINHEEND